MESMARNDKEVCAENCFENEQEVLEICEIAYEQLKKNFKINFDGKDGEEVINSPMLVAAIFRKIYEAIMLTLESMQKEYSSYQVVIANRCIIGYTNTSDDDEVEKLGNFMMFIQNMDTNMKSNIEKDPTLKAVELCTMFNSENITTDSEIIYKISNLAISMLDKIDVKFASNEVIMPIFITVYEAMLTKMKIYRIDADEYEYEVNFMSCFWVTIREGENGNDKIIFRPNIEGKLSIKNDNSATAVHE